jgi:hypothetical protein
MRRTVLLLPLAAALLLAGTADAAAKPVTKSFDVTAPVPFPVTQPPPPADTPLVTGCFDGAEGVSKVTTRVTLPFNGVLAVKVDFIGDWDLIVVDAKGKVLADAENWQLANTGAGTEKTVIKKAKKGPVDIAVCNWAGQPDATVTWTLTPAK